MTISSRPGALREHVFPEIPEPDHEQDRGHGVDQVPGLLGHLEDSLLGLGAGLGGFRRCGRWGRALRLGRFLGFGRPALLPFEQGEAALGHHEPACERGLEQDHEEDQQKRVGEFLGQVARGVEIPRTGQSGEPDRQEQAQGVPDVAELFQPSASSLSEVGLHQGRARAQDNQQERAGAQKRCDGEQASGGTVPPVVGLLNAYDFQNQRQTDDENRQPAQMPPEKDQPFLPDAKVVLGQAVRHGQMSQKAEYEQDRRDNKQSRGRRQDEVGGRRGRETPADQQQHDRPGRGQQKRQGNRLQREQETVGLHLADAFADGVQAFVQSRVKDHRTDGRQHDQDVKQRIALEVGPQGRGHGPPIRRRQQPAQRGGRPIGVAQLHRIAFDPEDVGVDEVLQLLRGGDIVSFFGVEIGQTGRVVQGEIGQGFERFAPRLEMLDEGAADVGAFGFRGRCLRFSENGLGPRLDVA